MPPETPLPLRLDYYSPTGKYLHKFRGTLTGLDHLVLAVALNRPDGATKVVIDLNLNTPIVAPFTNDTPPKKDTTATQLFEIRRTLINHVHEALTPYQIEAILEEIKRAVTTGPCAWAFKPEEKP